MCYTLWKDEAKRTEKRVELMDRQKRVLLLCRVAAALGLGLFLLLLTRPSCPILRLTGLRCAGCGGTRMVALLLQGRWRAAFAQNQYLFFAVPVFAGYGVWEAVRFLRKKPPLFHSRWVKCVLLVVLGAAVPFMIFRNL